MRFFCNLLFVFDPLVLRDYYRMVYFFEDTTAIHWMMMTAPLLMRFRLQIRRLFNYLRVDGAWMFEGLWSGFLGCPDVLSAVLSALREEHPPFSAQSLQAVVDDIIQSKSTYSRPVS